MIEQSLDKLQQNFICWEYYNVICYSETLDSVKYLYKTATYFVSTGQIQIVMLISYRSSDNKRISLNSRPVIVLQWRPNAIGRHRSGPVSMASFVQTREFPWLISSRKWLLSTSSFVLSCWTISCPSCRAALWIGKSQCSWSIVVDWLPSQC